MFYCIWSPTSFDWSEVWVGLCKGVNLIVSAPKTLQSCKIHKAETTLLQKMIVSSWGFSWNSLLHVPCLCLFPVASIFSAILAILYWCPSYLLQYWLIGIECIRGRLTASSNGSERWRGNMAISQMWGATSGSNYEPPFHNKGSVIRILKMFLSIFGILPFRNYCIGCVTRAWWAKTMPKYISRF